MQAQKIIGEHGIWEEKQFIRDGKGDPKVRHDLRLHRA